jgi:hypothetical protein
VSNLSHTPGPWSYNDRSANRVLGPDNQVVAATYGGAVGDGEQAANTRLIAAAPSMYEYLIGRAAAGDSAAVEILATLDETQ